MVVLVAVSSLVNLLLPAKVQAEQTWRVCSAYDSADPTTSSSYDLDYVCAVQYSDEPGDISFYLYFRSFITRTQFNTSWGSWAAMTIDTNYDGEYDLYIRTSNQTLNSDNRAVAGRAVRNGQTLGCVVDVWSDINNYAKWIGLSVNKSCAGIDGIGLNLQGYTSSEYSRTFGYDWAPSSALFVTPPLNSVATPSTTTTAATTTTTTTTTIPKVQIPNAPSSISIAKLSDSALRLTWLDNSTNEDGFIIQRNDIPVPAGTTTGTWPYRTAANSPTIDFGNLSPNRSYCFSISAFNSAGASNFTDSACFNLTSAATDSQTVTTPGSLTCDATRVNSSSSSVQIVVDTGISNAGKTLKFEVFKNGQWIAIGTGRTSAAGASAVTAKLKIVGKKGNLPIRATQGSRFICEGTLS